ncbi:Dabb family protein [Streptomyces sp. NRRL F-5126]|uniref:Dabb family protein n=1 Tax=Streptomyces sp. NRRL F-5126 TaxID=1463857 RepID=UPI0004C6B4D7|nr:Dabb family protein [Streptomyces sp. NRRL F-5126]
MIRHLVLFKLNEGVSHDDPRVAAGVAAFTALGGRVPEVESWEFARNLSDRSNAYDYAINAAVADADALRRYADHPDHQAGVALWREFATWVIADYEF